jgi:multiple sugar transport system ATP-binding protein
MNFLGARLVAGDAGLSVVPDGGTPLKLPRRMDAAYQSHVGKDIVLGIRPEHLTNSWTEQDRDSLAPLSLKVEIAEPLGADTLIFSRIGTQEVVSRTTPEATSTPGATIMLQAKMNHAHLFDRETSAALA